jgi:hypothetical protein
MGVGLLTLSMLMNEFPMTDVGFLTSMERDSKAIQQGGFGGGSSSSNSIAASATNSNSQVRLIDTPSRRRLKLRALLKANHQIELALLPAHFEQARLNKSRIIGSGSSSEVHLQADIYIFHGASSTPIVEPLVADERISVLLSPKMSGSELRTSIIGALAPKKEEVMEDGGERPSVTATGEEKQQQQQQEKDDNGKGPINAVADISQYSLHIRLPSRSWISIPFDDKAIVALCAGQRLIETMLICCVAPDRKL